MSDINRILVVSRMTTYSQETIKDAISLAWKYNAELFVLHVTHTDLRNQKEYAIQSTSAAAELPDSFLKAKTILDGIIKDVRVGGLSVKEIVKDGDPVEKIVKTIHDDKIDILVLDSSKESACVQILLNRIKEELVHRKLCPTIIAK